MATRWLLLAQLSRKQSGQTGAILLEVMLASVVFVSFIVFIIWLGASINARSALEFAVPRALRLAATRSDSLSVSAYVAGSTLNSIDAWLTERPFGIPRSGGWQIVPFQSVSMRCPLSSSTPCTATQFAIAERELRMRRWRYCPASSDPPEVLYQGVSAGEASTFYQTETPKYFRGENNPTCNAPTILQHMPPIYSYALAYLFQYMQQAVGPSLRYPCDPALPGGAGCLACYFLNPSTPENPDTWTHAYDFDLAGTVSAQVRGVPTTRIFMQCSFRPWFPIMSPLFETMGFSNSSVIRTEAIFILAPGT